MNRIQQLAKTVMDAVEGDDIRAAKALARQKIAGDVSLRDLILEWAIDAVVDAEWRAGRSARWHSSQVPTEAEPGYQRPSFGPTPPSAILLEGLRASVAANKQRLMDYEMEPGKRLADCTKPEIQKYAERLKAQADTMTMRSAWLRAVCGMLPDNKRTVKQVLREEDLTRLRRRVERQEAA